MKFVYLLDTSFYKWSRRDIIGMVSHNPIWERPVVLIKTDSIFFFLSGLASNNPFKEPDCRKTDCPLNKSGLKCYSRCSRESVIYNAWCQICRDKQLDEGTNPDQVVDRLYVGETSRTLHQKVSLHVNDHTRELRSEGKRTSIQDEEPSPSSCISDHAK